jgi:hypothetical protein
MQKPPSITNEEEWRHACQTIVGTAQAILRKELGIIEGARKICPYRFKVQAENDKDFIFFVGLDSETDNLPIGDVQRRWSQDSLEQKKGEIENRENDYRERALEACNNLISKYQT